MGDPIRLIHPCKTVGCDLKVARTSISGLCYECSDRRYRIAKKKLTSDTRTSRTSSAVKVRLGAAMRNVFEYENSETDMKAELSWCKEGDGFIFSTVTFRNGQVYRSKSVRSKSFDTVHSSFNNAVQALVQKGFLPVERI